MFTYFFCFSTNKRTVRITKKRPLYFNKSLFFSGKRNESYLFGKLLFEPRAGLSTCFFFDFHNRHQKPQLLKEFARNLSVRLQRRSYGGDKLGHKNYLKKTGAYRKLYFFGVTKFNVNTCYVAYIAFSNYMLL